MRKLRQRGSRTQQSIANELNISLATGVRFSAIVKLLDREGELTLLGFVSSLGDDGFTAARKAYLQSITFHLREAAVLYQAHRKLKAVAFAGAELLNRITRPALLLSVDRKVTHANPAGQQYLADGEALLLSNDRLIAFDAKSDKALCEAFEAMVDELPQGNAQPRRVIRLRDRGVPQATAVSLTAFVPQASMYTFGMALRCCCWCMRLLKGSSRTCCFGRRCMTSPRLSPEWHRRCTRANRSVKEPRACKFQRPLSKHT